MSLLNEYKSLGHLAGFQLGFYTFFQAFKLDESLSVYSYRWNSVLLSTGTTFEHSGQIIRAPCACMRQNLEEICSLCGYQRVFSTEKKKYFPSNIPYCLGKDPIKIDELDEFAKEQLHWIQTQKKNRTVKEECQRRINFFVQALHTQLSGKPNYQTHRGTCDPYLRDIRNLAHLCLKE